MYSSLATMIIGCVPLWIRIYDPRSRQGVTMHQRNHCVLLHMGFIGFFDALIMMQVILDDKS